jgi:hypothetical protein
MKLYPILFEQTEPTNEPAGKPIRDTNPDRFSGSKYALMNVFGGNEYALINIEAFKKRMTEDDSMLPEEWIAAYADLDTSGDAGHCSGATSISVMVASPLFPAAGYFMYCLMSKVVGGPITSDRGSSTTDSAKKTWTRIESSGDWKKVELDNYGDIFDEKRKGYAKKYVDVQGNWPDRKVIKLPGPKTPPEDDDCGLKGDSTEEINDKLGTANAYTYTGPYSADSLLSLGQELEQDIADELGIASNDIDQIIRKAALILFRKYYKAVSD